MFGQLIAFSGVDGAGKSTQIDLLVRRLTVEGLRVKMLWSRPGYTPLFYWVKTVARRVRPGAMPKAGRSEERERRFRSRKVRRLWIRIALVDLILYYGVWIRLLRCTGKTVICDRYIEDARLDFQLNFPAEPVHLSVLWWLLTLVAPKPDAAFLLLVPVDESIRRSKQKDEPFPDTPAVMQARFDYYRSVAGGAHWLILDGMRERDSLHQEICKGCGFACTLDL